MILLDVINHEAIEPALHQLPPVMNSPEARVQMLTTGLQESRFMYRYQKVAGRPYQKGPAMGLWQMERGGGVLGVLTHRASKHLAFTVCEARKVAPNSHAVWGALETDDVLAAAFARLLLWTDTGRLPVLGNVTGAWDLYLRTWRPGKPRPETWEGFYRNALEQGMA